VYKTEVKMNNLNPEWAPIVIKGTELNNGDAMKPLLIKAGAAQPCMCWDRQSVTGAFAVPC
jgi:hypothetical protein